MSETDSVAKVITLLSTDVDFDKMKIKCFGTGVLLQESRLRLLFVIAISQM